MTLNKNQHQRLYRAFLRKDGTMARQVFIAVRTTGIYCLLTCRARTPKPENVTFYDSRRQAENDGFRPCRKCRPEVQGGKPALERAALKNWLVKMADAETGITELAKQEGANPSRLYRLFRRNLGRAPVRARGEARLERACALLKGGQGSITEVAFAAGFASLATFYRWFRRATGKTPTQYRHRHVQHAGQH